MGLFDFGFNFSNSNAQVGLDKEDTAWLYQKQSDQWRANTEWYNKNGYTYLKEGLMNAGYNPLMALGASPLNGATVQGSAMRETNKARSYSAQGLPFGLEGYRASMRNVNADTTLKNAQADEVHTRETLEGVQKLLLDKRLPFETRRQAAEVLGLEIDNIETQARIQNIKADTELKGYQSNYTAAQTKLTSSQIKQVNQFVSLLQKENVITGKQAHWIKKHPWLVSQNMWLSNYTAPVGQVFGGSVGFNAGRHINFKGN